MKKFSTVNPFTTINPKLSSLIILKIFFLSSLGFGKITINPDLKNFSTLQGKKKVVTKLNKISEGIYASTPSPSSWFFWLPKLQTWHQKLDETFKVKSPFTFIVNKTYNLTQKNYIFCNEELLCKNLALRFILSPLVNHVETDYSIGLADYINNKFLEDPELSKIHRYALILELSTNRLKNKDQSLEQFYKLGDEANFETRSFFYFYQLCEIAGHDLCLKVIQENIIQSKSLTWLEFLSKLEKEGKVYLHNYHEYWFTHPNYIEPKIEVTKKDDGFDIKVTNKVFPFEAVMDFYINDNLRKIPRSTKIAEYHIEKTPMLKVCLDPDYKTLRAIPISEIVPVFKALDYASKPKFYIDKRLKLSPKDKKELLTRLKNQGLKQTFSLDQINPSLIITNNPKDKQISAFLHFSENKFILEQVGIQAIPYVYRGYISHVILHANTYNEINRFLDLMEANPYAEIIGKDEVPQFVQKSTSALCYMEKVD